MEWKWILDLSVRNTDSQTKKTPVIPLKYKDLHSTSMILEN
jgi:hypothetical protein